ncbi:winged helix-turn-helix transcriptional regulator [Diaphorobacter sp. HDW4A]|uniref:MarR family winged helix-turn-helix transcriptional regulator n=1 Tax=Diaphorobacter sp. HDW4A TaxID=2714924 RepID=UPI00140E0DC4|nr:MarR family winged helix-turn-helix transcriptional regulator [Diaphorobacter sp. HDW4A]QIL81425.1 winged helix-turn-helix transcriptional regulator [Diaphorobacter sp. HDW4A]
MNAVTTSTKVLDALHDLVHTYRSRMRSEMHRHDDRLNRNSVRCLLFVGHEPLCTHKALMDFLRADKAQVARTLNEMEDNGWIERVPHPDDRRSRRLQLSAQGQTLFTTMQAARARVGEQMLQGVPEAQQAELAAQLLQMQAYLKESGVPAAPDCGKSCGSGEKGPINPSSLA